MNLLIAKDVMERVIMLIGLRSVLAVTVLVNMVTKQTLAKNVMEKATLDNEISV
jgi:hypothetical protein